MSSLDNLKAANINLHNSMSVELATKQFGDALTDWAVSVELRLAGLVGASDPSVMEDREGPPSIRALVEGRDE